MKELLKNIREFITVNKLKRWQMAILCIATVFLVGPMMLIGFISGKQEEIRLQYHEQWESLHNRI